MNVSFPPCFAESITHAFLAIPNRTFMPFDTQVMVEDEEYLVPIEAPLVLRLMDLQQSYISGTLPTDVEVLLKTSSPRPLELYLQYEDLDSLFYVIDKVLAGAESVSLDGTLEVISP